jgi:hypothetical protein
MTQTHVQTARHRRSAPGRVSGERPSADTQVWTWAGSVVLSGYGPAASSFL